MMQILWVRKWHPLMLLMLKFNIEIILKSQSLVSEMIFLRPGRGCPETQTSRSSFISCNAVEQASKSNSKLQNCVVILLLFLVLVVFINIMVVVIVIVIYSFVCFI